MSWVKKWQGKHARTSSKNPSALGQCDYSDFTFNRRDLIKQMQWRGDSLQWTGFMVGRPYLDVPNEQLRPPKTQADPYAVINPRLPQPYGPDLSNSPQVPPAQQAAIQLNRDAHWNNPLLANGSHDVAVQKSIPDGLPVPATQQVTQALNKFHWGS